MQINTNINQTNQNITISTGAESTKPNIKNNEFIENTVISVEVVEIKSDEITVKTSLGELIKAKPLNIEGLKVSDLAKFLVKYENGSLVLKIQTPVDIKNKAIADILKNNSLEVSEQNIKLIETLISNNLPIDKQTCTKLNQIQKALEPQNIEKAIFFLENDIKPTKENIQLLNDFKNGEMKMSSQLKNLIEIIDQTNDKEIKTIVSKIFIEGEAVLKDSSIINNIIDDLKIKNNNKLEIAFNSKSLQMESYKDLAKELIKNFPDKKELINNLLQNKNDFINVIENLPENIKNEIKDILKEPDVHISNDESKNINKEYIKPNILLSEKLESILKKIDGFPINEFPLKENEIKFLVDKIFKYDKEKERFLTKFKIDISKDENLKNQLVEKFKFKFENNKFNDVDDFLDKLKENVEVAKKFLENENKQDITKELVKNLDKINKSVDFVSNLKNTLLVQLPITLNNNNINSEIFVFKDKNKKKSKNESTSALIALDTASLGRFETYIQKNGTNLTCQFRLKDKEVELLVKANLEKLNNKLKNLNYSLSNVSFKTLEEDFTILDKEPILEKDLKKSSDKLLFFDTCL